MIQSNPLSSLLNSNVKSQSKPQLQQPRTPLQSKYLSNRNDSAYPFSDSKGFNFVNNVNEKSTSKQNFPSFSLLSKSPLTQQRSKVQQKTGYGFAESNAEFSNISEEEYNKEKECSSDNCYNFYSPLKSLNIVSKQYSEGSIQRTRQIKDIEKLPEMTHFSNCNHFDEEKMNELDEWVEKGIKFDFDN